MFVFALQKTGINRTWETPNLSLKPPSTLVRQAAGKQSHCKMIIDYFREAFVIVGGSEEREESKWHSFSSTAKNIWITWENNEANPLKSCKSSLKPRANIWRTRSWLGVQIAWVYKGKWCLANLTAFHEEVTGSVVRGQQLMLFILTSAKLLTLSPITFSF